MSIYDTAIFLKFMARNGLKYGDTEEGKVVQDWYVKYIKDEFQGPSFQNHPEGESLINLIGKPYHSWNLISLLKFFPVEMVQAGGIYRQLIRWNNQGIGKSRADLQTLDDLRDIENLLLEHSTPEQI